MKSYTVEGKEYLVGTAAEANKACKEYIRESLWAFRPEFISGFVKGGVSTTAIVKSISIMQREMSEDSNETIFAMIGNYNQFVKKAIAADGRGHFLSSYDGEERDSGTIPGLPPGKLAYRID